MHITHTHTHRTTHTCNMSQIIYTTHMHTPLVHHTQHMPQTSHTHAHIHHTHRCNAPHTSHTTHTCTHNHSHITHAIHATHITHTTHTSHTHAHTHPACFLCASLLGFLGRRLIREPSPKLGCRGLSCSHREGPRFPHWVLGS